MTEKRFRRVNSLLDKQPNLGPFPADMIFPWASICLINFLLFKSLLQVSWFWFGIITGWACSTWWILTAKQSWKYLSKFVKPPRWVRAITNYHSPLENRCNHGQNRQSKRQNASRKNR
jgi:hypothetical protein